MGGGGFQLAVPVELVAKKIGNHDRTGRDLLNQSGQAGLIDLEQTDVGGQLAGPAGSVDHRRRHSEDEVCASLVGDDLLALRLEDVPQQGRRGRLAIGSRDHHRSLGERARKFGEDLRIDPAGDVARQRGPTAAPQPAAQRRRQLSRPERGRSARSQPGAHQAAAGIGRQTQAG